MTDSKGHKVIVCDNGTGVSVCVRAFKNRFYYTNPEFFGDSPGSPVNHTSRH